jgi:hypothetical protein
VLATKAQQNGWLAMGWLKERPLQLAARSYRH